MSVATRTAGTNLSAATRFFALAYRATARAVATVAVWYRRAHDRRQLAVLSTSFPGFLHDTGLVCTEADLWLRHWALKNRRRESNIERSGGGPNDGAFENGFEIRSISPAVSDVCSDGGVR